jgi:hypothetical protein
VTEEKRSFPEDFVLKRRLEELGTVAGSDGAFLSAGFFES